MSTKRKGRSRVWAALFVFAMILQSCLVYLPMPAEGGAPTNSDKVVHAAMFGGPTLLSLLAGWRWVPLAMAYYAPVSEIIQSVPFVHRDGDWHDAAADICGVLLAWGAHAVCRRRRLR